MVNYALAVCILVISFQLSVVLTASYNDERILNKGNAATTGLACPTNAMCNLTSTRCRSNRDCNGATPVCCTSSAANSTQGIRCCNPTTQGAGQQICPVNNPPPACRSADVCTENSQCFAGEQCCRTSFGGQLLNFSCCIDAARGPQCPAQVTPTTCVDMAQCGGASECPGDQVCCSINNSAAIRCCAFPKCPARITVASQCAVPAGGGGIATCGTDNPCAAGQICCYPGNLDFSCCVNDPPGL